MADFDVSSLKFEPEEPEYDLGSLNLNLDGAQAASAVPSPVKAVMPVVESVKPLAVGVGKGVMGKVALSLMCSMLAGAIWNSPVIWQGIKWAAYIFIKTAGPPAGSEKLEKTEAKAETPLGKAQTWLEKHAPKPPVIVPAVIPPVATSPAAPPGTAAPPVTQPEPPKLPPVKVLEAMKEKAEKKAEDVVMAPVREGVEKVKDTVDEKVGEVRDTVKEEAEKFGNRFGGGFRPRSGPMLGPRNARRYGVNHIPSDVMTRYGGDGPPVFGNDGVPVLRRIPGPARDNEEHDRQQLIVQAERAGIEWDGRSKSDVEDDLNKAFFKNAPNARCPNCKVALKLPPDSRERRRCKWCRSVYSVPTALKLGPPPMFNAPIRGQIFRNPFSIR